MIVTGSAKGFVQVWRPTSGLLVGQLFVGDDGTKKMHIVRLDGIEVERVGVPAFSLVDRVGPRFGPELLRNSGGAGVSVQEVIVAHAPDPIIVAVTSDMDLFIWKFQASTPAVDRHDIFPPIAAMAIVPIGNQPAVACGSRNGDVTVHSLATLDLLATTHDYAAGASAPIRALQWTDLRAFDVVLGDFSVFIGGDADGLIHVWASSGSVSARSGQATPPESIDWPSPVRAGRW